MEEKQQLQHLYALYLNNTCTAQELELFFKLIRENNSEAEIQELLSATWDNTHTLPDTDLVPTFLPKARTIRLRTLISAAAAILLVLGSIYFFRSDIINVVKPIPQLETASIAGEYKQLKLTDGTKVWLSPNSKLDYPAEFKGNQRLIHLDGEAFFEVAHDAKHPFVIKTGSVSTTVLGTSFNIMAYTQQHTINVTLVTGKVAVALEAQNNTQQLTMLPNQQIIVDKQTKQLKKVEFPGAASFLNKRLGLFEYKGAALEEVVDNIEALYNIKVQLTQELSDKKFYGTLNMKDGLNQTLNKLCLVMEIKWEENGGQYVILK